MSKKVLLVLAIVLLLTESGCGKPPQKSRVPPMQEQIDQAQQAADRAKQAEKNIQANIDKLDHQWRNSDGGLKVGHPEVSGIGSVTDVGETRVDVNSDDNTKSVFWFTFSERTGFVKKFSPVCLNQEIPTGSAVILNFHWREYTDSSNPGCFLIDGYTVVK